MRYQAIPLILLLATAACGGNGTPGGPAHPDGWTESRRGGTQTWTKPNAPGETFVYSSAPASGTTKDLASQVTLDVVLKRHGKLLKTVAFAPCPGEAGLQTYSLPPSTTLLVAYAVYNDKALIVNYARPNGSPEDSGAMDAMRRSVCTAPIG